MPAHCHVGPAGLMKGIAPAPQCCLIAVGFWTWEKEEQLLGAGEEGVSLPRWNCQCACPVPSGRQSHTHSLLGRLKFSITGGVLVSI